MPPKLPLTSAKATSASAAPGKGSGDKSGRGGYTASLGKSARATAEGSAPARKENSAVNSAPGHKKRDASAAKKAGGADAKSANTNSSGSGGLSKGIDEYDKLEYIAPLSADDAETRSRQTSAISHIVHGEEDQRPGKKISMKLVASKALGPDVVCRMAAGEVADAVMKLDRVLLDDECIEEIDNLEALGAVKQLHLQRNRLQRICNLESLQHLQLLSLASNDIMDLRNLTCLRTLKALDVGYNLLDEVPACELPQSLRYLTTEGNPLRKMEHAGAWDEVYSMPNLLQHDCQDLPDEEEEDGEQDGEDDQEADSDKMEGREQSTEVGSEGISRGELMDIVVELGRKRMEAAAKVFEDSMAVLRDTRTSIVEAQRQQLAQDRAQQDEMYAKAVHEVQDMKQRQSDRRVAQGERMGHKWNALALAEREEASGVSEHTRGQTQQVEGANGGANVMTSKDAGLDDAATGAKEGSDQMESRLQAADTEDSAGTGKGVSVLKGYVDDLRPE